MRLLLFYFILLLLVSSEIIAQKGKIEGYISDEETRTPLAGASIIIPGNKGDNSDMFGRFSIQAVNPGQYELIVTHVSYKTEIVPVEVRENLVSSVNISLKRANLDLSEVKVNGKKNSSFNTIGAIDIMLRPVNTSQDVLRIVPGLFIAQHAGGGKAEQIFLRGYDIDHGTDISITVDGMPVNMVSHAHGQGYADLHFLIPELVEKVNFDKGPYFTGKGNQATAGYVEFNTKEFLKENRLKLEAGRYSTQRAVGMLKIFNKESESSRRQFYIASEYFKSDGYFESPQNFHRFNLLGKYNAWFGKQSQLTITGSVFGSRWNASGQIPARAVRSGMITRFGSIDDSEGGNTGRSNFTVRFARQLKNNWKTIHQFYFSRYHFNLYSNFTFYLNDSINGDGIQQREKRNIAGYSGTASKTWWLGNKNANSEFGAGFRADDINDIELNHTVKRQYLFTVQKGDVKESNAFAWGQQNIELTNEFTVTGGLRLDIFRFSYRNLLQGETGFRHQQRSIVSPKLNFTYTASATVKIYFNNGIGFHSNDSRVILSREAKEILPKVYGSDLGIVLKPVKNFVLKTALWHLYSQQEFVYVGDEGIVEPAGKTRRTGLDFSARYQLTSWLFADLDMNFTRARIIGASKGENYVPLAPSFTSIGGITAKMKTGFSGSLRYRLMTDRPANETKSVMAQGYFIADAVLSYALKKFEITLSAENMLNTDWREAQFDTESRLQNETAAVSEIHYTPGTPRFLKAGISFKF